MATVGSADVIVRAITNKVRDDIQKAFRDSRATVQAEGREAARAYASGFANELNRTLGPQLERSLGGIDVSSRMMSIGQEAGAAFSEGFDDQAGDGVEDSIRSAGIRARRESERSLGDAGRRGGDAFRRGFLDSGFSDEIRRASRSFTLMLGFGNLIAPALSGLVSGLSSVVSGLFAMSSAASQAVGSLAALPGTALIAAQAIGTLRAAFSGVGDAITAGFKAADVQMGGTTRNTIASSRAIADAQKALQRAYQDAAEARRDAAIRVSEAERSVAEAQRDALRAQQDINVARRQAVEDLQQLAFDAEDAALAEERAALRLEDARNKLVELQSLPPDDRARREAELSFREAELAFRRAKDRNNDMAAEQDRAAKAGVEGSEAVVKAKNAAIEADKRVATAERNLAQARQAQSRQARDSAQAIADAQERLRRAIEDSRASTGSAATALNNYNQALSNLSPQAQEFVRHLVGMRDEFRSVRDAAGSQLFGPLSQSLDLLVGRVFPILRSQLADTGGILGTIALQFTETATNAEGLSRIESILDRNNRIMEIFTTRGENGRSAIDSLASVILRLADAIGPITERFATWIAGLFGAADAATDTRKEMQGLRDFLERAGDTAAQLGDIFGNLWESLRILGSAATPAGQGLLDSFERATEKLNEFLGGLRDDGTLGRFFEGAAGNLRAIGDLINAIGAEFFDLGDNPGVGNFARSLIPVVENIGEMIDRMTLASPAVGKFLEEVTRIGVALTDSGMIEEFVNTLSTIATVIADALSSEVGQQILMVAGSIAAITRATSFALRPISFFFKALMGGPLLVGKAFMGLYRIFSSLFKAGPFLANLSVSGSKFAGVAARLQPILFKLGPTLLRFAGPIGLVVASIPLLITAFRQLYQRSPEFKKFVDAIVQGAKDVVDWFKREIPPAIQVVQDIFRTVLIPAFQQVAQFLGTVFTNVVVPAIDTFFGFLNTAIPKVAGIVMGAFGIISNIVTNVLIPAFEFAWGIARTVFPAIMAVARTLFTAIKFYITNIFLPFWRMVFNAIQTFLPVVRVIFRTALSIIQGVFNGIQWVWRNILSPVIDAITTAFGWVYDAVSDAFNGAQAIFRRFRRHLENAGRWIGDLVGGIIDTFAGIGKAIGDAFGDMGSFAVSGINRFIRFINSNLIGNINKVTGNFGLTIPAIPVVRLAQGGRVRGQGGETQDNIPSLLSRNEFVVKARSARRVGYDVMEYINQRGELPPHGGWGPLPDIRIPNLIGIAKDTVSGVKNLGETIAKEGLGKVLETVIKGATKLMSGAGIKRGSGINDFFYGIMDALAKAARDWAGNAGKTKSGDLIPPGQRGSYLPPYEGPPGGWTYPLARRYPAYTFPGHNPPWAVDIGAPGGVAVRAASAGRVVRVADLGGSSYGRYMVVSHAGGVETLYAHLSRFVAKLGDIVRTGQTIGYSGNTGGVRGSGGGYHLHFELRPSSSTIAAMLMRGVRLASGGVAQATPGGILATIAEAGKNERVEPLDREGFSKRDRAILDKIAELIAAGGRGDEYNIYPAPGMSELELAKLVARNIRFNRRPGT